MIWTITPNPALDITYRLGAVRLHATNRVADVSERPGGKGVNVARVADRLGAPVSVSGFLGGHAGDFLHELLASAAPRVEQAWCPIQGQTRRTVALVDDADATMLNEAGPHVGEADWAHLTEVLSGWVHANDVVSVCGSLPPGSTSGQVGVLVAALRTVGARVIVDTTGEALLSAAQAGADLVKPNVHELREATAEADTDAAARALLARGAGAVLVSAGPDGLTLYGPETIRQAAPSRVDGNPTGAGDAVVAALAVALHEHPAQVWTSLREALPLAAALGAAAVASPVAGEFDRAVFDALRPR